jgi:hypothetical protein
MKRALLSVAALGFLSARAYSQQTISEKEFRRLIEPYYSQETCVFFPVGKQKYLPTQDDARFFEQLKDFERIGVVSVANITVLSWGTSWKAESTKNISLNPAPMEVAGVELLVVMNSGIDASQVTDTGDAFTNCLKAPPPVLDRIVKIDPAKGGTTLKWDGSVVYATTQRAAGSKLFTDFVSNTTSKALRALFSKNTKRRVLFKHDAFSSKWKIVNEDVGEMDAEFATDNVVRALRRD